MRLFALAGITMLGAGLLAAQEAKELGPAFRLEFKIQDGSDAAKGGRRYAMMIGQDGRGTFRIGSKIPYDTGGGNISFADIGVNIDCRIRDAGANVLLTAEIDISNIKSPAPGTANPMRPTISQVRTTISSPVPVGTPSIIATIEDPVTQQKFEVIATVQKLK
jgi:hypothetical protein